jgi:hypothetical protein
MRIREEQDLMGATLELVGGEWVVGNPADNSAVTQEYRGMLEEYETRGLRRHAGRLKMGKVDADDEEDFDEYEDEDEDELDDLDEEADLDDADDFDDFDEDEEEGEEAEAFYPGK